ncbi:FAS1-like dehydratase domain-containing protein [Verminephrobacter eiseniae]|uniref:FAS1-like dehydratase domain-containing protein n=1 Tax=Verminephrobacter eiseniae TaxID=364317 RepID=UPI00224431D5|nr:MaoC family dehydratase N-terminal domain-containing protein [Verminephrobacter eiseniae]
MWAPAWAGRGGLGDETEFLYEEVLRALPTQASVLAYPGFWMRSPEHGVAWQQVVHGEQRMRFPSPLTAAGQVRCQMAVSRVADKGEGKGAIVVTRRILSDSSTQMPVAIIEQTNVCRGDGGYAGGDPALSDVLPPPIPSVASPVRAAQLRSHHVHGRSHDHRRCRADCGTRCVGA